jgi:hypothetical protein
VAAALAMRDKVFARLPYYARWLAAYRGTRLPIEVDQFVVQAENAFRDAHHITDLIDKGAPSPERLAELDFDIGGRRYGVYAQQSSRDRA